MKKVNRYLITIFLCLVAFVLAGLFLLGCETTPDDNGNVNNEVFNVLYTTDGNGTVQGEAEQTVPYGGSAATVTAVPNAGYKFVKWSDTGSDNPVRTDENVTDNLTATAEFEKIKITVTYNAAEGGTIDGVAVQEIEYGDSAATVTAVPNAGYKFVKWSDTGSDNPVRTDENVTDNLTATAEFEKIKITVTYNAAEGGTIDGVAVQEIEYGDSAATVTAVPNAGYKFVKWSDTGSDNPVRTDENVTDNLTATAEFEFLYGGGSGSLSNPYLIENYAQLKNMLYCPDAYFRLVNDLDLEGISHEPIFNDKVYFSGSFNGGGHSIKNLSVNTQNNFPSLFGFIGNASVSDFSLVNVNIEAFNFDTVTAKQNYYVGSVAGVSYGFIHDITVSGAITANGMYYDGVAIGGIVGMAGGTIANCSSDIQMEISDVQRNNGTGITLPYVFGGFAGVCDSALIRECNSLGAIKITQSSPNEIMIGGLIGYYFTSREVEKSIKDCTADIEIYGDSYYDAGGFIGRLDVATGTALQISNCIVYGDITAGHVGGFIGRGSGYGLLNIEKCHTENVINPLSAGAGFIYWFSCNSSTNSSIQDCYFAGGIIGNLDSGRGSGFGHSISGFNILRCYVDCDISIPAGVGFIHSLGHCNMEQCYYSGTITCKTGSGFCRYVSNSRVQNSYSVATIYPTGNTKQLYGFIGLCHLSEIFNCYFYGENFVKIFSDVSNSNIVNFHTIKPNEEGALIGSITDEIGIQIDITPYDSVEEMFNISDKLNKNLDGEVWVNVENGLPKLKYTA